MAQIIGQSITVVAKKLIRNGAEITPVVDAESVALIEEILSEALGVIVELDTGGISEPFDIPMNAKKAKGTSETV